MQKKVFITKFSRILVILELGCLGACDEQWDSGGDDLGQEVVEEDHEVEVDDFEWWVHNYINNPLPKHFKAEELGSENIQHTTIGMCTCGDKTIKQQQQKVIT